jgi:hypothetical protein
MRYLGAIAKQTTLTHVREICEIEMIARTLKEILNSTVSSYILKQRYKYEQLQQKIAMLSKEISSEG